MKITQHPVLSNRAYLTAYVGVWAVLTWLLVVLGIVAGLIYGFYFLPRWSQLLP